MARQAARRFFDGPLDVSVNTADNPAAGDLYLTVTGTSAESGDDGQVGRGNRVCGLITPYRPMTLEAAAGKNPVNHVGKLYNLAAPALARRICNFPQVLSATCTMVSQIGRPIDDPDIVDLGIQFARGHGAQGLTPELETGIRDELSALPKLQAALLAHEIRVY
jgi:S-adenosylmethionine synthetase